jgi:MFS family permease
VTLGALAAWPIGWLADRWDRRWVLALCVLVWSAATYGGGLSQGFDGLLWAMVGLAIGEAALLPIVYALTPQVVPARQLSVANAAVYATLVLGSGLALVAGGAVYDALQVHASRLPWPEGTPAWRLMFFVTALLGLPVVLLMLVCGCSLSARRRTLRRGRASVRWRRRHRRITSSGATCASTGCRW